MEETKMSEVIVITSGKGGVGKTTTTANVGTGLAKEGKKVVLIDTDFVIWTLSWGLRIESFIIWLTLWKETAESNRQ